MKRIVTLAVALLLSSSACAGRGPEYDVCADVISKGMSSMDVTNYVSSKPGHENLGTNCTINSLVFAQCFLQPGWTVKKAVDVIIFKTRHGQKMPAIPQCGA